MSQVDYPELRTKVQAAYRELRKEGYACRSNFSCCQNCARHELADKGHVEKVVFWHMQDTDSAKRSGKLYLAWSGNGREIARVMRKQGLTVKWDNTEATRIRVHIKGQIN
jgi:hypothetical protein